MTQTFLSRQMQELEIAATYNLLYNASLMVKAGMGCAVCLGGNIPDAEENGLCFRPLGPPMEAALSLIWKKHQVFSRLAERLPEMLRQLTA